MTETPTLPELLDRYREAARQSAGPNEAEATRWAYEVHTCFKILRETEEGRAGITALMRDPDPQVRRWAATHCLMWNREEARSVLRSLGNAG